jgi:iron complex outermembrane receptor protein
MGKAFGKIICFSFLVLLFFDVQAQTDSTILLDETIVKGFETNQSILKTGAAVSKIDLRNIERFGNTNLSPAFNSQAGVRFEERSPGSYRIAIRGSSLRSPFGVRNVKVYWNAIPISDANGQSYFNQLDMNSVGNIEILRGPSGSIYGAGIGGVVNMQTKTANPGNTVSTGLHVGSFGTVNSYGTFQNGNSKSNTFINFSRLKSDGYRENSAVNKNSLNLNHSLFLSNRHTLNILGFLSELDYQTPGGLTLSQNDDNPKASRPKTPVSPSAIEQKAAIRQKIAFFGLSDQIALKNNIDLNSAIFFTTNKLENPFITNFEKRNEYSLGYRVVLSKKIADIPLKFWMGSEGTTTNSTFAVYDNNLGLSGAGRYSDEVKSLQNSIFGQLQWVLFHDIFLTAGLSYNLQSYDFVRTPLSTKEKNIVVNDKPVVPFTPRISILKAFNNKTSLFFNLSNGFSAPTVQEFVSTIQTLSQVQLLKAEKGINKEIGLKSNVLPFWNLDWVFFHQNVKNGLVRNLNTNGEEYFTNTGGLIQKGMELSNNFKIIESNKNQFFKKVNVGLNFVVYDFKYQTYLSGKNDFSGNYLPGVAKNNLFLKLDIEQRDGFYIYFDNNYLSKIPLNDANDVFSDKALVSILRLGYVKEWDNSKLKMYGGIDNLMNAKYSAGYDFNAFGNRFYNPAPPRNYNIGIQFEIKII